MDEDKGTDWKGLLESPIKKHSTIKVEEEIAKCLSGLVGEELKANIKFIDYNPDKKSISLGNPVEIHMVISKPTKDLFKK